LHHFTISASIPYLISGPWQVTWNPPVVEASTPISEPGACLTLEKWNQLVDRNDPVPAGLGGKILTTVNEGGPLPAIYVSNLDGTDLRKIVMGAWPSLSSDGTRLVYSVADGLHVFDLSTGQSSSLGTDGYRLNWSPDSTRILYTTTFNLYVINADGSGSQKIPTGSTGIISSVGWLPDNQTIVYGVLGGDGFTFTTYDLQNGKTEKLFSFQNKAGFGAISPDGQWIVFSDRIFGAENSGIFIARLDGSERKLVASPDVPTAFASAWSLAAPAGASDQWLIVNTRDTEGAQIPVLVNPFTCQAVRLQNVNGMVEGWSP
jgi:Tol biopolymer transport system component